MKACKNCNACKKLYRLYNYMYSGNSRRYYCTLREELTEPESVCESWRRVKKEYDLSPQRFDEAEKDVKKIIALLSSDPYLR